jgi:hypothetical protein
VTKESASVTEPWVAKHEASYPYAYDKGGKLQRFFGVRGIPHAILVDPTGKVAWRGHPARLDGKTVEAALDGALTKPLYTWPSAAKPVVKAILKGDWTDALEEAGKLSADDGGPALVEEVRGMIESRLEAAEAALEAGNFLGAQEQGETLVKGLKGLPEAERAQRVVDAVDAHPDSKAVIKAQEKIRKIRGKGPSKRKEIERAIDEMKEIVSDFPGTYVAEEASAYMDQLRQMLRR